MALKDGNGKSVPTSWLIGAMLTILLMVVGLYTASVTERIDVSMTDGQTTRAIVDTNSQRISRLEAQGDAIIRSLDRIEKKLEATHP